MEDKSIQGGLYRFQDTLFTDFLSYILTYRSGRTNTLSVPFRSTLIGEGKGKGEKGIHILNQADLEDLDLLPIPLTEWVSDGGGIPASFGGEVFPRASLLYFFSKIKRRHELSLWRRAAYLEMLGLHRRSSLGRKYSISET